VSAFIFAERTGLTPPPLSGCKQPGLRGINSCRPAGRSRPFLFLQRVINGIRTEKYSYKKKKATFQITEVALGVF